MFRTVAVMAVLSLITQASEQRVVWTWSWGSSQEVASDATHGHELTENAGGRAVRTLASGRQRPGTYTVTWNGTDGQGRAVPNGIYFYRLDAPGFRVVKKAVVMK